MLFRLLLLLCHHSGVHRHSIVRVINGYVTAQSFTDQCRNQQKIGEAF